LDKKQFLFINRFKMKDETTDPLADLRKIKLPFDIDDVTEQCHKCIRKQLKKYEKFQGPDGRNMKGRFIVPCSGIMKEPVDKDFLAMLPSQEARDEAEQLTDIVKWASANLKLDNGTPWDARWYQEEVLRCNARRKVLRISRRAGKTDLVCVEICFNLFTNPNLKIVVAGPQKTHTEEIVNRVRSFIRMNPALANMVTRDVSAPWYEIVLTNGSRLRGFAAGAKGTGAAVGIRGQDADKLYLEEMDYIDENAIKGAVLPILQTNPNTHLVGFSTPSGFRTPYYECCQEDPQYTEFHYTYKVLPHWKSVEADRARFTEEEWGHEFLASFGSSESGVYRPEYIDSALSIYEYEDIKRSPVWRYCIGVDWNEKHGTEIVVVGQDKTTGIYKIVESTLVTGSEYTQLSGIARLLEVNRKWKPDYIYIDSGNGSTNDELLRKMAFDERKPGGDRDTARLLDIMKKYDSGSAIPTQDPVTGEDIRMPAKPFMVNASIRIFEQKLIKISSSDSILEKQLRSYMIDRYTPTKTPVYVMEDKKLGDHRLDALNLALVAFHLNFDDIHVVTHLTNVAIAPDPRTGSSDLHLRADKSTLIDNNPSERRLDANVDNLFSSAIMMSARVDSGAHKLKTDRLGWKEDREDEEMQRFLQKRRSRKKSAVMGRPSRSTF
jgi:hypothetical protein